MGKGVEQIRQQAQNENTPPNILVQLSNHQDILTRRYVALNPNTPVETLGILGQDFPDLVKANPIFLLLLLENPESSFVKLTLARSSTTSAEVLENLADFNNLVKVKDIEIIYAIASNLNTPIATIEKLLNWHPSYYYTFGSGISSITIENKILFYVVNNKSTPDYLLERLGYRLSKWYNNHFQNTRTQSKTIHKLQQRIEFKALQAIASHQNSSQTLLEYLSGENCSIIHKNILNHKNVSTFCLDVINFIRGKSLKTPDYILERLAQDQRSEVRKLVAQDVNTSIDLLKLLSKDKKLSVLLAVAQNSQASSYVLERLAGRPNKEIQRAILNHVNTSYKAQEIIKLIRSKSPVKIDDKILEELANDERTLIRKQVVQNELTPAYILQKLTVDTDKYIRDKATAQLNQMKPY